MSDPVRTCLGCGATGAQRGLVRVRVGEGGRVQVDGKRSGGRGGWLHPVEGCLARALRRRAFARAFRRDDLTAEGDVLRRDLTVAGGRD